MPKNKPIHITYIGRLEKEKGLDLICSFIKRSREEKRNIVLHICGDGSYMNQIRKLEEYEKSDIKIYGHIGRYELDRVLDQTDLVLMPSLFLETFGLVALETLTRGVPVCGFAHSGLTEFIHPSLVLHPDHPIDSLCDVLDRGEFPLLDVSDFAYDHWRDRLIDLTRGVDRILLVSDYTSIVGGAEQYVHDLSLALTMIGKQVEVYGYRGDVSRGMRIWLMCLAPFAFWRGVSLGRKITEYQPDLIWMHSILRYIGPHGVRVVSEFAGPIYVTHHDLGLITPYPSQIYTSSNIPVSPSLGDWIAGSKLSIFAIFAILAKWLTISSIWIFLRRAPVTHIFPSLWMQTYFAPYAPLDTIVFPHTSQKFDPVKS